MIRTWFGFRGVPAPSRPPGSPLAGLGRIALLGLGLTASGPEAHAQAQFELNLGTVAPKGTPWMDSLLELERQVEEASQGRINVIIRPAGHLGEVELAQQTLAGERLQACAVTTAALAAAAPLPQLSLIELPFLFRDEAQADYVLDEVLFPVYSELLADKGLVLGVWSENGFRSFATRGAAATSPEVLAHLRMRAQPASVHVAMYEALGTTPVTLPLPEVSAALASGAIDGLDNTALYIQAQGLLEPIEHFTLTRHIYQPAAIVFSKAWFSALPDDLQKILRDQRSIGPSGRQAIREAERGSLESFELFGVEVHTLTEDQRAAFVRVAQPLHSKLAAEVEGGPALLSTIREGIKKAPQ